MQIRHNLWSSSAVAQVEQVFGSHHYQLHATTVNRIEMVRIAGKLQRDQKCMLRTTFYFRHMIDQRYQAARELIENNGKKFDTCVLARKYLLFSTAKARKNCEMESETEAAIGGIQDFSAESPEQSVTESFMLEEFTETS